MEKREAKTDDGSAPTATEGKVKLYSSWFCPFAQRAWISLEARNVPYELVEVDPYAKGPELMAVNPRGLVPALKHGDQNVYESLVCIEYIDEAWPASEVHPPLLPRDPYLRAVARIWIDFISKKIVPTFYRLLQRQASVEQEVEGNELLDRLKDLSEAMTEISPEGPFFMGPQLGAVDITLAPFVPLRLHVLEHYRGFSIPATAEFLRLRRFTSAIQDHPKVKSTVADPVQLRDSYRRYADNTATSQVAIAINSNKSLP